MSSIQTIIIIAVVILIIVVIASMLLVNRKQMREIEVIDASVNEILKMHLENDIERLDKMDLAGESLTTLIPGVKVIKKLQLRNYRVYKN